MLLLKPFTNDHGRPMVQPVRASHQNLLSLRMWVWHPNTRIYVRLLGPCFKTGRLKPFCQDPWVAWLNPSE